MTVQMSLLTSPHLSNGLVSFSARTHSIKLSFAFKSHTLPFETAQFGEWIYRALIGFVDNDNQSHGAPRNEQINKMKNYLGNALGAASTIKWNPYGDVKSFLFHFLFGKNKAKQHVIYSCEMRHNTFPISALLPHRKVVVPSLAFCAHYHFCFTTNKGKQK